MSLWIAAVLIGYFIKGLCGFANTLVITSIMSFSVNNANISPVDMLLGCWSNLIMAWKNRSELDRSVYLPLSALVLAGCIPGAWLLKSVDAGAVKVVFGEMVVCLGGEMFWRERRGRRERPTRWALAVIGVLAGVFCGMFGVGALLAAYVGRVTDTSAAFKANLSAVFLTENIFRGVLYGALGLITRETFETVLLLAPFMPMGLFAGMKSSALLHEGTVRRITILLLILSGFALIFQNL